VERTSLRKKRKGIAARLTHADNNYKMKGYSNDYKKLEKG
jgi:hypothetical protein